MININFSIASRLPSSQKKRRLCFPVISNILCCVQLARKEGGLALESFTFDFPPSIDSPGLEFFFETALSWVIDGLRQDDIIRFFNAVLSSKDRKDNELLSFILVAEGMLAMKRSDHPKIIYNLLLCWVGIDLQDEFEKLESEVSEKVRKWQERKNNIFFEEFFARQKNKPCGILDKFITELDDNSMHNFLRASGEKVFEAFFSCRKETIELMFDNMTVRLTHHVKNTMRRFYPSISSEGQKEAVEHVISILNSLNQ